MADKGPPNTFTIHAITAGRGGPGSTTGVGLTAADARRDLERQIDALDSAELAGAHAFTVSTSDARGLAVVVRGLLCEYGSGEVDAVLATLAR